MTTLLPSVAVLEMTYRCNHACRFCSCPWFAGMLRPEPKMCGGCDKAAKCLGGCREAARVFSGSPTAPDPIFEMDKKV